MKGHAMTPDERAAMERLQANNYTPSDDYVETPYAKYRDLQIVYDAFLREHPEGEEVVACRKCGQSADQTPKSKYCGDGSDKDNAHRYERTLAADLPIHWYWLTSIGFRLNESTDENWLWINSGDEAKFDVRVWHHGVWDLATSDDAVPIPALTTRGEVLLLLRALKVEVKHG